MSALPATTRASLACAALAMSLIASFAAAPPARCAPDGAAGGPAGGDPAAAEDIRDIRGPKGILPAWLLPALLAGGVVLAAGAYAAWRWKRRRALPRPLLPYEITLQKLEETRRLMDPSSVREFSIAISDIVRHYIEDELKVTATHRTTEEFLHDLLESSNTALVVHRGLLAEFLHHCDLAKFGGMSLPTRIMQSLLESARSFVIETSRPTAAAAALETHDQLPAT
jgi:hypothetical protein